MAFALLPSQIRRGPQGEIVLTVRATDATDTSRIPLPEVVRAGVIVRVRATASAGTVLPRFVRRLSGAVADFDRAEIGQTPGAAAAELDTLCTIPYLSDAGEGIDVEAGGASTAADVDIEVWIRPGWGSL